MQWSSMRLLCRTKIGGLSGSGHRSPASFPFSVVRHSAGRRPRDHNHGLLPSRENNSRLCLASSSQLVFSDLKDHFFPVENTNGASWEPKIPRVEDFFIIIGWGIWTQMR